MSPESVTHQIRLLKSTDLDEVMRIDALHSSADAQSDAERLAYWGRVFHDFLSRPERHTIGLGVVVDDRLAGYLFGEVRAFEFGSKPCGWVFAVGVDDRDQRSGVAKAMLAELRERFRATGVTTVRTMVRRNDVPVLSFFRAAGFVGGPFVQLELELEYGEEA